MDNVVGRLIYKITGDASLLNRDLSKCNDQLGLTADEFKHLSSQVKTFATRIMTGMLIKSLLDASSALEELEAKFNTVFKGVETETKAWAENYAKTVNRGVIDTQEFMATIQDIQTGYGMATEEAAEFSKAVVGITNDLASFSNIPFEQAMQSVQSGLAQQFESLRQLGVGVSVEIINQGEYAEALGKTWLEMSNLERQQAILNEIVKQSPNALHQSITSWQQYNWQLGDAARTADSYANTSQGFAGTLRDTAAQLGDFLLPSMTSLLSAGNSLLQIVNAAPAPLKALAVAATAAGVALNFLGTGLLGIVTAGSAGLLVFLMGLTESSDKLEKQTKALATATSKYSDAVKALSGDTSELTTEQRLLYEAQMKIARSDALKTLKDLNSEYTDSSEEVSKQREELEKLRGEMAAFDLLARRGSQVIPSALANLPDESSAYVEAYRNVLMAESLRGELTEDWENAAAARAQYIIDLEADVASSEGTMEEAIYQAAVAVNEGILTYNDFIGVNEEITTAVFEAAKSIQTEGENAAVSAEDISAAVKVTTEWRDALRDLKLEQAQDSGDYNTVFRLRALQISQEKDAAIRALAEEYSAVIATGEDIAAYTTGELREKLAANEETAAELAALDEYYTLQIEQNAQDRLNAIEEETEKKKAVTKEYYEDLVSTQNELREAEAESLISNGNIEEGFAIRRALLEEEHQRELELYNEKLEAGEASESDRLLIEENYRLKSQALRDEETQAYFDDWAAAEEERTKLEEDEKKNREQAEEEYRQKQMDAWKQFYQQLGSAITSFYSSYVTMAGYATDSRIQQLEAEEQALLESLGLQEESEKERLQREMEEAEAKGDHETAQEKARAIERLRIEEETDHQIAKLEREQAIREKNYAVFEATINTLAAVIKAMVDPGGYAGIAIAALAAAMGAAQIAAINAQPLPSYDVGALDISEDHIAKVHNGEMIIPKTFADSVRDGDISIGNGSSNVEVIIYNYTGAEVKTEEFTDRDTRKIKVLIGQTVETQINEGRYDQSMITRFGLRRNGLNG